MSDLFPSGPGGRPVVARGWPWALALLIILVAYVARVYSIFDVPHGLTGDEAVNLMDITRILGGGYLPLYFEANTGREPLFIYLQTPLVALLGPHPYPLRLTSALIGVLTVALTYRLTRDLFRDWAGPAGRWAPGLTSLLLATSFWHITLSRIGLRAISLPLVLTLALLLFWRAYSRNSRTYYLASGAVLGLSLYTYVAGRLAPLVLALFLVFSLLWRRAIPRPDWRGVALMASALCLVAAPLAFYGLQNPDLFWGRIASVSTATHDTGAASTWESSVATLGMFVLNGNDYDTTFDPGGRPVFDWVMGVVFAAGLALALASLWPRRLRRPPPWLAPIRPEVSLLCLLWLAIMVAPSAFSSHAPSFLRAVGAAPAAYIFPALGLGVAASWLAEPGSVPWKRLALLGVIAVPLLSAGSGLWDYARLATSDRYFYELDSDIYEIGLYMKQRSATGDTLLYGDTALMSYGSVRALTSGPAFSSFDSRWAVAFPPSLVEYVFLDKDASSRDFGRYLPAGASPLALSDSRGKPSATAYRANGTRALTYNRTDPSAPLYWANRPPAEPPAGAAGSTAGQIALRGYGVSYTENTLPAETGAVRPGGRFRVTLAWEALSKPSQSYHVSVKAFDTAGQTRAQKDSPTGGGRYPTDRWRPGEWVYDTYDLTLDPDAPPGSYRLEVTVYDPSTLAVFPVLSPAGQPLAQHYRLGEIAVR